MSFLKSLTAHKNAAQPPMLRIYHNVDTSFPSSKPFKAVKYTCIISQTWCLYLCFDAPNSQATLRENWFSNFFK